MIGLGFCDFGSFCGACLLFPTLQFFKVTRDKRETERESGWGLMGRWYNKSQVRCTLWLCREHMWKWKCPPKTKKNQRVGIGFWFCAIYADESFFILIINSLVYDEWIFICPFLHGPHSTFPYYLCQTCRTNGIIIIHCWVHFYINSR